MRRLFGNGSIDEEVKMVESKIKFRKDLFRRDKVKWIPILGYANTWDKLRSGRVNEEKGILLNPNLSEDVEEKIRRSVKYFEDSEKPENEKYRRFWDLYQKICAGAPAITGVVYLICKLYDIL